MRPNLPIVPEKSQEQPDLQARYRARSRLVSLRTATLNRIRAFLIEQGITVRKELRALKTSFETILEDRKEKISPRMRSILIGLYGDWMWMDDRIDTVSEEIKEISRTEENGVNVMTIRGFGPMISTAMVAAVGTGETFRRGVILQPGSAWCPASKARAVEPCWGECPGGVADICECSLFRLRRSF